MHVAGIQESRESTFRHSLIEDHLWLARRAAWWAKSRLPFWIEFEDVFQSACLGLVQAAHGFKPDRSTPFSAYARKRVYGAAIDPYRRQRYPDYRHSRLREDLAAPESSDRLQESAARALGEALDPLLPLLPRRQQMIIASCSRGAAIEDVAHAIRISTSLAHDLYADAVKRLRCAWPRTMHIAIRGPGVISRLLLPAD